MSAVEIGRLLVLCLKWRRAFLLECNLLNRDIFMRAFGPKYAQGCTFSNLCVFSQFQRILNVYAQIPDRVFDLGVTQQDLNRAKVSRRFVDD